MLVRSILIIVHTKVRKAEKQFRDVVNRSTIQDELIKNPQKWNQLCASMDIIGDTDTAIVSYRQLEPSDDVGILYLTTYGLLQVLFVQQDAIRHAAEAVDFNYTFSQELRDIREVRNCAVGHPARRDRPRTESFGIVRTSLSQQGFTLYSFDWSHATTRQNISFPELIDRQTEEVCHALAKMTGHLNDRFRFS